MQNGFVLCDFFRAFLPFYLFFSGPDISFSLQLIPV